MQSDWTAFYVAWAIAAAILVACAAGIGKQASKTVLGILIDERKRFSLNRLQLVMWTLLVLSTLVGLFVSYLNGQTTLGSVFKIDQNLLVLMGISVGSATTAGAVKSAKDLNPNVRVQRAGILAPTTAAVAIANAARVPLPASTEPPAHFSQIFLEEEGSRIDEVVDVTKFQNFFFTLAIGLTYVVLVAKQHGYPTFDNNVLWLLGISHAGYVAGKLPTKA